jgi:mono/diheme cytochrome c family protein
VKGSAVTLRSGPYLGDGTPSYIGTKGTNVGFRQRVIDVACAAAELDVQIVSVATSVATAAIDVSKLPTPPGASSGQVVRGYRIFRSELAGGTCSGCHGSDAAGSTVGPDLTRGTWLWSDGSWRAIAATINRGVLVPKESDAIMPPKGGAPLSASDVDAVAAFVWAVGHRGIANK